MELLKNNLPLISVCLLISAIVRLFAYYSFFNIDIASYIEISEVIQLQFVFLTFAFVSSAIVSLLPLALLGLFTANNDKIEMPSLLRDEEGMRSDIKDRNATASHSLIASAKFILKIIPLSLLFIFVTAYFFGLYNKPVYETVFILILSVPVLYALRFCQHIMARNFEEDKSGLSIKQRHKKQLLFYNKYLIIIVLVFLLVSEGLFARFSAFSTLVSHGEFDVKMLMENKTVMTNDTLVYVGKTKNYLFLYNKAKEDAVVYPTSSIKEIHFANSKRSFVIPKFLRSRWYKEIK